MKLISIVIPNWNGIKFIKVCLDSVFESRYKNFEVILVDNGSEDGSREYIEENYPDVCVIKLMSNKGFAHACNEGIKNASGEYIVLLNNDVEVDQLWLTELFAGMERHHECSMGTSKMVQYDSHKQFYNTGDLFNISCTGGARGFGELDEGQYDREEYVFGACAGAGIYRKELFWRIGLFDEKFFIFSEDVDFNLRAQLRGERCVYIPKAVVYHWGTATIGFNSNRHVFLFLRNDLFVLIRNYLFREYFKNFKFITKKMFNNTFMYSLSGQGPHVFKSYLSFLWHLPGMILKRIKLIAERKKNLYEISEIGK